MGEIREFHKQDEDKSEQRGNFTARIVLHRLRTALRFVIIIGIIVTVAIVLVRQYNNQQYNKLVIAGKGEKQSLEGNSYLNHNGSVITYSKDGISSTDGTGKVLWNMTYEMQNPIVHRAEGVVAVCDYNGHIIYMINSSGREYEIDTNLPIRDFAVSSDERVAAIVEDAGCSWINLYDINGNQLVEVKSTMSKTGYPLSVALSGEVMGVSYFYVDSDTMRSSVTFYNFGGIGENTSDHIVSSYDYADAVVPVLGFLDAENVYAVSNDRLMFYSGAKKPVSSSDSILSENIVGVYSGDTNIGLVFYDITGTHKYRLDLYKNTGEIAMSYLFDMDFKDILIHNNQVMIYNESQCIVVNSEGAEKFSGIFEDDVLYLCTTDSNKKYIAVTRDAIETLAFE